MLPQNNNNYGRDQNIINQPENVNINNILSISEQKANISKQISDFEIQLAYLEAEIETLKNDLMAKLSLEERLNLISDFNSNNMIMIQIKTMFSDPGGKKLALYKLKVAELESQRKHLSSLQRQLSYLNYQNIVSDITRFLKNLSDH